MSRAHGRRLVAVGVLVALPGCWTATISCNDGSALEARITGSDDSSLRVRDRDGADLVIPGNDVQEIDHPGNVLLAVGAIVLLSSLPMTIDGDRETSDGWRTSGNRAAGITGLATGLALATAGLIPHVRSTRASAAFEESNPVLPVPRPVLPFRPSPPWRSP